MRLMAFILACLLACSTSSYGVEKAVDLAALNSIVSFKVTKGPLQDGLKSVEAQTGVRFSFFKEWFAQDVSLPDLDHKGSLRDGLSKLLDPKAFEWEPGVFGGIVVRPKNLKVPSHGDWIADQFNRSGILIVVAGEMARAQGAKTGDVIVALNGESYDTMAAMHQALMKLDRDAKAVVTVLRDGKEFEIQKPDLMSIAGILSAPDSTYAAYPTLWDRYQKGGHKDPKWDDQFRQFSEELYKSSMLRRPDQLIKLSQECIDKGCHDPLLLSKAALIAEEGYGPEHWSRVVNAIDADVLRKTYGGSFLNVREKIAIPFGVRGVPAIAQDIERHLEAAWSIHRAEPVSLDKRELAHSVAASHFLRGEYETCVSTLEPFLKSYRESNSAVQPHLGILALQKLGQYENAARWHQDLNRDLTNDWVSITQRTLAGDAARFKGPAPQTPDRLSGTAGMICYKLDSVGMHLEGRMKGMSPPPVPLHDMPPERHFNALPFGDLPPETEVLLFVDMHKEYLTGSWTGVFLGSTVTKDRWAGLWKGSAFLVSGDMTLERYYANLADGMRGGFHQSYPLPGFANNGQDVIRICKDAEDATVRCNGAWVVTDTAKSFAGKGQMQLGIMRCISSCDVAILTPTPRCYDNDRMRSLSEKILSKEKMEFKDVVATWDDIARLSPPDSQWRKIRPAMQTQFKMGPPNPPLGKDAPPLEVMTQDQAKERLGEGGELQWCLPDPMVKDDTWCARSDGTIAVINRTRYWTETYPQIRAYLGSDVKVAEPLFSETHVWFPTNKGLFALDRKGGVIRRYALGGLIQESEIVKLALNGTKLVVLAKRREV